MGPMVVKSQPEIRDFQVAIGTDEEVVWFDISVDASKSMGLFDAKYHLSDVESSSRLGQDVFANQKTKKVAPRHVVHEEVKIDWILETGYQGYHPSPG